jgi:hypothetical protein
VVAYYFPGWHADPRNDVWHGQGWTEWELLKAARPRFAGHRQPRVPAWGHFDESDPAWAARQIDLAADHGVTGFVFDWYWYDDGPFLQAALERGFLQAPNNGRLKFALMWANHDWVNIQPASFVNRPEVLTSGAVSDAVFDRLAGYVVERYFHRPNYLTLDGRPYFSIYDPATFVVGLGGVEAARRALERFRAKVRGAGFPGLHLNAIAWDTPLLGDVAPLAEPGAGAAALGLDSVGSYTWIHHSGAGADEFPRAGYARCAAHNARLWDAQARRYPVVYHPNVSVGWDSSPRTVQSDAYAPRGYPWLAVLDGNTPEAFRAALARARAFVEAAGAAGAGGAARRLVTVNAWNEWTEGSYLLPDTDHGTTYLEAVRDVFGSRATR